MTDKEEKDFLKKYGSPDFVYEGGYEYLIKKWAKLVKDVEIGDICCIDDYFNDLDSRLLLELIGRGEDPKVQELDQRFKGHMTETDKRIWGSYSAREVDNKDWWNFGYPKTLPKEQAEEFSGYLDPRRN